MSYARACLYTFVSYICTAPAQIQAWAAPPKPWSLERAIHFALKNNPDAHLAEQRIIAAQAGLKQADAALWPQLQLESSYSWTNNPVTVFGAILNQRSFAPSLDFNEVPATDNLNIKGTLNVSLYAGGSHWAQRRAAKASERAARYHAAAVHNTLAFEVARTFHTILKTRAFIRATTAAVSSFQQNLGIARKRFAAGTLLKTDVLDVAVRLAKAREDLVRANNANALARRTLRSLLGIDTGEITIADAAPKLDVPAEHGPVARAELAAVGEEVQAAEAGVRSAEAGYHPQVDAFGSVAYDYGAKLDGGGLSYIAGIALHWNIWSGFDTVARVQQARARVGSNREMRHKLRLAIDLEIQRAHLSLKEATERLAVNAQAIAQAEESVQLTRARFEQGLALATQLIDAETALTATRVRRAQIEADQRIAVAALRKALGLPQVQ